MVALTLPRFAMLLAAACGPVGCASAPTLPRSLTLTPGQPTVVQLRQKDGLSLSLQNATAGPTAEVYSGAVLGKKVIEDATMQALLDVFTAKGLFAQRLRQPPGDAKDVLTIQHDGEQWLFARRQLGVRPEEQAFHEAKAYFLELYNNSTAYHTEHGPRPDFDDEAARARAEAAAAKARLERPARRPQ